MKCKHCGAPGAQLVVVCAVCDTTSLAVKVELLEILALFVEDWEQGSRGHHHDIERRLRAVLEAV